MSIEDISVPFARLLAFCKDRHVTDLGAGACVQADILKQSGIDVVGVDGEFPANVRPGVERIEMTFLDYLRTDPVIDVALLSWPAQYRTPGLIQLLWRAKAIIYWGTNCFRSAAGEATLWRYLSCLKLVEYYKPSGAMERQSALLIYENVREERNLVGEEVAALDRSVVWERSDADRVAAAADMVCARDLVIGETIVLEEGGFVATYNLARVECEDGVAQFISEAGRSIVAPPWAKFLRVAPHRYIPFHVATL